MEGEYNMAKQKQKPFNERSMETTQAIRDMLSMFSYLRLSKVTGIDQERLSNLARGRSKKIKFWELKVLQRFIDDCINIIPPDEYW